MTKLKESLPATIDRTTYPKCQLLQFVARELDFIVENMVVRAHVRAQGAGMRIEIKIELSRMYNRRVDDRSGRHVGDRLAIRSEETCIVRLLNDDERDLG